tara:strand:+ start:133 stop:894 length:762 start_codon:yes stop_codon:yes gene_type:complete
MKIRVLLFLLGGLTITSTGCKTSTDNLKRVKMHPGIHGFDWDNDPLDVSINWDKVNSGIGNDTLILVRNDLYDYFHLQQTGDSVDYFSHTKHYIPLFRNDTTAISRDYSMSKSWREKGYINRVEVADIFYASPWIVEDSQRVAIIGYDLLMYVHFLEKFEGEPKGMESYLKQRFENSITTYHEGYELTEEGDTVLVRHFKTQVKTGMLVLSPVDSLHFNFISETAGKSSNTDVLMGKKNLMKLLRDKHKHLKE